MNTKIIYDEMHLDVFLRVFYRVKTRGREIDIPGWSSPVNINFMPIGECKKQYAKMM